MCSRKQVSVTIVLAHIECHVLKTMEEIWGLGDSS